MLLYYLNFILPGDGCNLELLGLLLKNYNNNEILYSIIG